MENNKVVLVYGNGGREHCLAWKLSQSPKVKKVFCCPGNAGTERNQNKNTKVENCPPSCLLSCNKESSFSGLVEFCQANKVNLVVVGPEKALCDGITDAFASSSPSIRVFGPSQKAAVLEGSKKWSKDFMQKYQIPTAEFQSFTGKEEISKALRYIDDVWPKTSLVVKASGLASGKGVFVPETIEDAKEAVKDCLERNVFGNPGNEIIIEEHLYGIEASIFALCDGNDVVVLPAAQDYKRALDNDKGSNTGGMGALCPADVVTDEIMQEVNQKVLKATLNGMNTEGRKFVGCLFVGLMITKNGPKILEFNVRFGDPETQVILPLVNEDLFDVLMHCASGTLRDYQGGTRNGSLHVLKPLQITTAGGGGGECSSRTAAVAVVMASGGYPKNFQKGFAVAGAMMDDVKEDSFVFHAGTKMEHDGVCRTTGGRVLAVTGVGNGMANAREAAYNRLKLISFDHSFYRTDIAQSVLTLK
eukprot:GHVS01095094.1.p1 GENE.GHVS01095094.1~~GHVS01095094.1.p1  ORF type:complete len:474 (-),score=77.13 GHVS01095094.1:369-1790(-)